jgi:catechol 2,3-dioxygenase-like lactoylglutathione lyase family enzyme
MAQDNLRLGPIGQIAIPVTDLDRAVVFYRDALEIPFLFRVPNLAFFANMPDHELWVAFFRDPVVSSAGMSLVLRMAREIERYALLPFTACVRLVRLFRRAAGSRDAHARQCPVRG